MITKEKVGRIFVSSIMFLANISCMLILPLFIIPFGISAIAAYFFPKSCCAPWIEKMYDNYVYNPIKKLFGL